MTYNLFQVNYAFIAPTSITHWCQTDALKTHKLESLGTIFTSGAKINEEILKKLKRSIPHVSIAQGWGKIIWKFDVETNFWITFIQ